MKVLDILTCIFLVVSILVLGAIWCAYKRYSLSIKHPNSMFFVIVTVQILGNTFLLVTIFLLDSVPLFNDVGGPPFIMFLRYMTKFVEFFSLSYIMVINIEILIKLKRKLTLKHKSRVIIYNLYCIITSALFTIFGRLKSDNFLPSFKVGVLFFEVYLFSVCIILSVVISYVYIKFCSEIRSKDMLVIVIQSAIGIVVAATQMTIYFFYTNLNSNDLANDLIYFIISLDGIFEFIAFTTSPKMREIIVNTILCKKKIDNFSSVSDQLTDSGNITMISQQNIQDYRISQYATGFVSDVFEKITKYTLIKMFVSLTLRFGKDQGKISECNQEFKFSKSDLQTLHQEINLNLIKNSNFHKVDPEDLKITDCYSELFKAIRSKYTPSSIYSSLADSRNYYKLLNLFSESGGRSNSLIFVTSDEQYVIKTITKHEYLIFTEKLIRNYAQRIIGCPESRMVRIFGLLYLSKQGLYVIIMENILRNKESSIIFDLKGSKVGREVKNVEDTLNPPKGVVLKDVNFENLGFRITMNPVDKEKFRNLLVDDFLMLKKCGIMDYSILLSVTDLTEDTQKSRLSFVDLSGKLVTLGIIDIFQEYNICKISETVMKSIFNNSKEVSSMDPEQYFERIKDYLLQVIQ